MKKLALLLSALLLAASFAGCGETPSSSSSAAAGSTVASEESTTADDNTLIMATNAFFEPYEYYEGDEVVGIDAEVGKAIADKLGMEFKISDIDFDSIIPAIQSGKASMGMAGMTVTPEREENVSFTRSYATGIQVVIVPEDSTIWRARRLAYSREPLGTFTVQILLKRAVMAKTPSPVTTRVPTP